MYPWTSHSNREAAGRRKAKQILAGYEQEAMKNTLQIGHRSGTGFRNKLGCCPATLHPVLLLLR